MDIILVHGFGDSGRRFARLQRRLVAAGHHCHCPTLKPADARHGIVDLARKLAAYIEAQLPGSTRFAMVGFSMGCLISRTYLQQLGGSSIPATSGRFLIPMAPTIFWSRARS